MYVKADISKEEDIKNLVSKTVEKFDKLDIMFANAGINIETDVHDMDLETWHKVIDINLTGVFLSDKYAIEQFQKQRNGGVIVNSGSIHSCVAREGLTPYSSTKGGVKMLTQQIAAKYSKEGIRTNAIAPAHIRTSLINHVSEDVFNRLEYHIPIVNL